MAQKVMAELEWRTARMEGKKCLRGLEKWLSWFQDWCVWFAVPRSAVQACCRLKAHVLLLIWGGCCNSSWAWQSGHELDSDKMLVLCPCILHSMRSERKKALAIWGVNHPLDDVLQSSGFWLKVIVNGMSLHYLLPWRLWYKTVG